MVNRDSDGTDFLGRVLLYGLLGAIAGQRGSNLALLSFGAPIVERLTGVKLEEALAAMARQQEELERQKQIRAALDAAFDTVFNKTGSGSSSLTATIAPSHGLSISERDAEFRKIIVHPSVVLILGKRGSGKSALGYRLLELFRYGPRPYVVGVPGSARSLVPDWVEIAPSLEEVPPKAIVLVDETYLHYHARGSMAAEAKAMSQHVNLSRQREQTIIFVSQEARQVDRNIASSANVIVFKDLGMLQLEFDRPELNKLAAQAKEALVTVREDKRRWNFVYAPDADFIGLLENNLPSFWKPSLSHLFAAGSAPSITRTPTRMTLQEKVQKAREMRAAGASYGEIARALGIKSRSTVQNYVKGYPYQRSGLITLIAQ